MIKTQRAAVSSAQKLSLKHTITKHALGKYVPEKGRSGIGLCLSGGGFRASLFHLGALRRLNELGMLGNIATIASVSGGSILAAHVATRLTPWPKAGEIVHDWEETIAAPFREFVSHNFRIRPLLSQLSPWNWDEPALSLAREYCKHFTHLKLSELPPFPRFVFCATDMTFGVNFTFSRNRIGDYEIGHAKTPKDFPLCHVVAASSCFPPVFNPLPIGVEAKEFSGGRFSGIPMVKRKNTIEMLRLTDGGVYDNLGLEPVWKDHRIVLVSDGGKPFDSECAGGFFNRIGRYVEISGNQALSVRKRWLMSNFISGQIKGTYWGIGSAAHNYGKRAPAGYSETLVDDIIANVRTDLDAFSVAEIAVLENHGYLLCEAATRQHTPSLRSEKTRPRCIIPHPQWMDETTVRRAMRDSHDRKLLGRFGSKQPVQHKRNKSDFSNVFSLSRI